MTLINEFTAQEQGYIDNVVQLSLKHVKNGGSPFAALVVDRTGSLVAEGVNLVNAQYDPTAHAEIQAIRAACSKLKTADLSGMTLYASGEPCAMCYMAAQWAGITRVYFASDRHEAALEGFDYRWSYDSSVTGRPNMPMKAKKLSTSHANIPFKQWNVLSESA